MERVLFTRPNPFEPARYKNRIYLLSPHMIGLDAQRKWVKDEDPKWYKREHATGTMTEIDEEQAARNKPEESCIILSLKNHDVDLDQVHLMTTLALLGCPSSK